MLEKFSLKTQIIGLITVVTTITLVMVSLISITNIAIIGDTTTESVSTSIKDQLETNILKTSDESASLIERKLKNVEANLDAIAKAVEQLFSDSVEFIPKTSYLDFDSSTLPPDAVFDSEYNKIISKTTSAFYIPNSNPANLATLLTPIVNDTILRSSNLDFLLQNIYELNSDFAWIRLAFEEGHILRIFPGTTVDSARTYDPVLELWYTQTKNSAQGSVEYLLPHTDAIQLGWLISISKSMFTQSGSFLGVISIELILNSIQEVVDITFLESGYASLIQEDGIVLAHPKWNPTSLVTQSIQELEIHETNNSVAIDITTIHDTEFSTSGITEFLKNNENYLVSYTPVNKKYYFLVIIKESEALQIIANIQSDFSAKQDQVMLLTVILSIVIFVVILSFGLLIAIQITKPISKLSKIANQITQNVTNKDPLEGIDLDVDEQDDEIGALTTSFIKMLKTVGTQKVKKEKLVE